MANKRGQYRLTVWPHVPLDPIPVWIRHEVKLVGDRVVYGHSGTFSEYEPLPDQLVIRELLELDLADDASVVEFLNDYGSIIRPYRGKGWHAVGRPSFHSEQIFDMPVDDVRPWLAVAARLARFYVAASSGQDAQALWNDLVPDVPVRDEGMAWGRFCAEMNVHLAACHASLSYGDGTEGWAWIYVDLFEALCLQLHQLIATELPMKTCANESCKRPFVYQVGTAEYGQYRSKGVKYCSRSCAWTQGQHERRRRQRREPATTSAPKSKKNAPKKGGKR